MDVLRRLLDQVVHGGDVLLDCPSGYGRLTELLQKKGCQLISGDLNLYRVRAQAQYFAGRIPHTLKAVCDVTQLPLREACVDGTVSFRLFHHLRDASLRREVFRETARVSRRYLLISYYGRNPLHALSRRLNRNKSIRRHQMAMLGADLIREEAAACGWHLVETRTVLPGLHAQTLALFLKHDR